uniref:Uncharacterized protein n=1 Tax=Anguilla anguilla TaxID=7936 RepID=A0A0E9SCB2_ANGAN
MSRVPHLNFSLMKTAFGRVFMRVCLRVCVVCALYVCICVCLCGSYVCYL